MNQDYIYTLGFCDECGQSINHQATHYQISEIKPQSINGNFTIVYNYKPALNYTGTDEVEIKLTSGSNGSSPNNIIHFLTIKFSITN